MMELDDFAEMLNEICGEIPREFFKELNGGVVLRPERKYHPASMEEDLLTMGEYHHNRRLGRTIFIYYGSFAAVCGSFSEERLRKRVRETVLHEFTHHFESLAGERDLEIDDAVRIAAYKRRHREQEERKKKGE